MTITINGTTGIAGVDGSASTPAVQGTDTNTGIFFPAADTIAFGEGGAEVARFDSSGNLGIGTSSPVEKLHVAGKIAVSGTNPSIRQTVQTANLDLCGGTTVGTDPSIQICGSSNPTDANFVFYNSNSHVFRNSAGSTERARINSDGLMLLGLTSTLGANNGFLVTRGTASNFGILVGVETNGYNGIGFVNASNSVVGTITVNSGGTAYNTTSDYRLKENVAPMTGALATVSALKPCTYTWKADGAAGQGFIAHELQAVVPDCVTGAKDATETYTDDNGVEQTRPKYQGVDTSYLVATLTAAIQELKAELDTTKTRLAALEAK
jgi:hypothetical protein